jgi:hypothetical protein
MDLRSLNPEKNRAMTPTGAFRFDLWGFSAGEKRCVTQKPTPWINQGLQHNWL